MSCLLNVVINGLLLVILVLFIKLWMICRLMLGLILVLIVWLMMLVCLWGCCVVFDFWWIVGFVDC